MVEFLIDGDKKREFFPHFVKEYEDDELIEIRLWNGKWNDYVRAKQFAEKYGIYINSKSSLFFTKKQVHYINYLINMYRHLKICYSVNPRVKDEEGEIKVSGLQAIKTLRCLMFDVECNDKSKHEVLKDTLLQYIAMLRKFLERYNLVSPYLIDSGRGFHLLYKINPQNHTESRREWLKEFYLMVIQSFDSELFHVDPQVKDVSRVFSAPGFYNPKYDKKIEVLEFGEMNAFVVRSLRRKKVETLVPDATKLPEIEDSLEWQILVRGAPQGERHNSLVFPLKLLLRDKGIVEVKKYENIINTIYGGRCDLSSRGTEGKQYHPNVVKHWRERNLAWCQKEGLIDKQN